MAQPARQPVVTAYEQSRRLDTDQRDSVQKKTFTKWINKHLIKCQQVVGDLFEDLRDGRFLLYLLEVLTQEPMPVEKGTLRFHKLQNVQTVLDFLKHKGIRLVNIRADEIVDGNPKLTLGLVWTIILQFQISDVIASRQESNLTAREALLLWSRKTCAGYPGVNIQDFSRSWRDGLAFLAILHRNRPELVDFRAARQRSARQNLEMAFNTAEQECGVTRLLDPEDVDVEEPDEKSLITYVSSLYDVFPKVPAVEQSLTENEIEMKWGDYRDLAATLHQWLIRSTAATQDHNFPTTQTELKMMLNDFTRFRTEEVPRRLHDKYRLGSLFDSISDDMRNTGSTGMFPIEPELHPDNINRLWENFSSAQHERDLALIAEISRLERLQRLAEKVHRDCNTCDDELDGVEHRLEEDGARIQKMHPTEARRWYEAIAHSLKLVEDNLRMMTSDVQSLKDGRFHQAELIHRRVYILRQRWASLSASLQERFNTLALHPAIHDVVATGYRTPTPTDAVLQQPHLVQVLKNLQQCLNWVGKKQDEIDAVLLGHDFDSTRAALESHRRTHEEIEHFKTDLDECISAKRSLPVGGQEVKLYNQHLAKLEDAYLQLKESSSVRLLALNSLLEFLELTSRELDWLKEKEELITSFDVSSQTLPAHEMNKLFEQGNKSIKNVISDMKKHEPQFSSVQDHGEALIAGRHPAAKSIENLLATMQSQWSWLLQLTSCMEVHIRDAIRHQQFSEELREVDQWIRKQNEVLNNYTAQYKPTGAEAERMTRDLQEMKQTVCQYEELVKSLERHSRDIIPIQMRSQRHFRPVHLIALCPYRQLNMTVDKGEPCTLLENSLPTKWRVRNSTGIEGVLPSICFQIVEPSKETEEFINMLRRELQSLKSSVDDQHFQLNRRVLYEKMDRVKSWDLAQFQSVGVAQREQVLRTLTTDAEKALAEMNPRDPEYVRIQEELRRCTQVSHELTAKLDEEARKPSPVQVLVSELDSVCTSLDDLERRLTAYLQEPLPLNGEELQQKLSQHQDFESHLKNRESNIDMGRQHYQQLGPSQRTPAVERPMTKMVEKWEQLWSLSKLYGERLEADRVLLSGVKKLQEAVALIERSVVDVDRLNRDGPSLRRTSDKLQAVQKSLHQHKPSVDQLQQQVMAVKQLVARTRPGATRLHPDVHFLENEVEKVTNRWENVSLQVADRLVNLEGAAENLHFYLSSLTAVEPRIRSLEDQQLRLPAVTAVPAEAQWTVEASMKLYNEAKAQKFQMEELNKFGGKYIKEVKIYERCSKQYISSLKQFQPSFVESILVRYRQPSAADEVSADLRELNSRYLDLLGKLHHRLITLKQIHDKAGLYFPYSVEGEAPTIRTFRSELRVLDADEGYYPDDRPSFEVDTFDRSHVSPSYAGDKTRTSQTVTKTVVLEKQEIPPDSLKRYGKTELVREFPKSVPLQKRKKYRLRLCVDTTALRSWIVH